MQIQTKPAAGGFVAALYYLFFIVLALQMACMRDVRGRSAAVALESAVRITTTCIAPDGSGGMWLGSGVIVNDHTVLTAAHIAEDPPGTACIRTVQMVNGKKYLVVPSKTLPERDLASLETVLETFFPTYPITYGPAPAYGERVCSMTAYPMFLWRCGDAQTEADPPGDRSHTIVTEGGNSGSGVYDSLGRLVGIITHRWSCSNGQYCGGKFATLEGYVTELL